MRTHTLIRLAAAGALLATCSPAQMLDPAKLVHPTPDTWPMYNGDYSGRRFSPLSKISTSNIDSLSLSWVYRLPANESGAIKSAPVLLNGVLYFTLPDHVWAVDARDGREVWNYTWQNKGGIHIGNRGVGISGNWLYFETPDCNLVSLNLKDGKERWHTPICDLDQFYFGSVAPLIIKNHVITGVSGDDLDIPGYMESHDPETGALQWRFYTHPKKEDPEAKSWPNIEAMTHGGGMTWGPSTYDPELNLLYFGTGNPQPVISGKGRMGDNLYTESIIALNPDTGKMQWYFQPSPHDTHDWDAIEVPMLIDGTVDGQPRKLIAQASRNGYFFVLDRTNGKNLITTKFANANWAKGLDAKGQPIPDPAKMPQPDGSLVSPNQGGAANWPPPAFNPQTGLFYINASDAWSIYYIYDDSEKPEGWAGNDKGGYAQASLEAIDYKTGKIAWRHVWEGPGTRAGVLTTAGNLVFTGDAANNFVAVDAKSGTPLWHANLGSNVSNGPITYELDGTQYLVVGAGDTLWGFSMLRK